VLSLLAGWWLRWLMLLLGLLPRSPRSHLFPMPFCASQAGTPASAERPPAQTLHFIPNFLPHIFLCLRFALHCAVCDTQNRVAFTFKDCMVVRCHCGIPFCGVCLRSFADLNNTDAHKHVVCAMAVVAFCVAGNWCCCCVGVVVVLLPWCAVASSMNGGRP
jgi:hypothetical protein